MKGEFQITSKVSDKDIIETCLNYHHSGYDASLLLVFHSVANSWNFEKFFYYQNLIPKLNKRRKK